MIETQEQGLKLYQEYLGEFSSPRYDSLKLLVTTVPRYIHYDFPPAAFGVLQGVARTAGHTAMSIDINLMVYLRLYNYDLIHIWRDLDKWMAVVSEIAFKVEKPVEATLKPETQEYLSQIVTDYINLLRIQKPEWLGLSLFTRNSYRFGNYLIRRLKDELPEVKILIGGAGCSPYSKGTNFKYPDYENLKKRVDGIIASEGEIALKQFLDGNLDYPGINEKPAVQIDPLDQIPMPDFKGVPIRFYRRNGKIINVESSRGCIRRCNFCDVFLNTPKYVYKSGARMGEEIFDLHQNSPGNPNIFVFNDSLVNGNMKQFNEMNRTLHDLYQKAEQDPFWLEGYSIITSPNWMKPRDFILARKAGWKHFYLGLESGSEEIRIKMNKKVKQSYVDYYVNQCFKNKIGMTFLVIIGHPDETEAHFQETLDTFTKFGWMNAYQPITVYLFEYTPYFETDWTQKNLAQLHFDENEFWTYDGNPDNTREERLKRLARAERHILELGYKTNAQAKRSLDEIGDFSGIEDDIKKKYGNLLD